MDQQNLLHLEQSISEMNIQDPQALVEYIPVASRLAAGGIPEPLENWQAYASHFGDNWHQALIERCREGLYDLREMLGEDLALALIDAQDWMLFFNREKNHIPSYYWSWFDAWQEEANRVSLDQEAVEAIEAFLQKWDIPEEERLLPLIEPMSDFEESLLDVILPEVKPIDCAVSETKYFQIRREDDWDEVIFWITPKHTQKIRHVRLGMLPAIRQKDGSWKVRLPPFDRATQDYWRKQELVIHCFEGRPLRVVIYGT